MSWLKVLRSICLAGLASVSLLAQAEQAVGLTPLTDDDMEAITGQQGIAVNLELRINSTADGEPLDASSCPTVAGLTGGASCRLAFTFNDIPGAWAVLKSYRGIIKLSDIRLDGRDMQNSNSAYRDLATYMGGYDPNGKPALQLTAGRWAGAGCDQASPGASCYNYMNSARYEDMTAAVNMEQLTVEFDGGGQPGYLRNEIPGAPVSLRLAHGIGLVPDPDNPPDVKVGPYANTPAQIRLDGRLQVHGFGF